MGISGKGVRREYERNEVEEWASGGASMQELMSCSSGYSNVISVLRSQTSISSI